MINASAGISPTRLDSSSARVRLLVTGLKLPRRKDTGNLFSHR
jgi:hypothetical protein